jgi:hypothetical protein
LGLWGSLGCMCLIKGAEIRNCEMILDGIIRGK